MDILEDPILWRGIERILVACVGGLFGILGYRLFIRGLDKGKGELELESQFLRLIFSGTGPGLFFMLAGAVILATVLLKGSAISYSASPGLSTKSSQGPKSDGASEPPAGSRTSDERAVQMYSVEVKRLESSSPPTKTAKGDAQEVTVKPEGCSEYPTPVFEFRQAATRGPASGSLCQSFGGSNVPYVRVDPFGEDIRETLDSPEENKALYTAEGAKPECGSYLFLLHGLKSRGSFVEPIPKPV